MCCENVSSYAKCDVAQWWSSHIKKVKRKRKQKIINKNGTVIKINNKRM